MTKQSAPHNFHNHEEYIIDFFIIYDKAILTCFIL